LRAEELAEKLPSSVVAPELVPAKILASVVTPPMEPERSTAFARLAPELMPRLNLPPSRVTACPGATTSYKETLPIRRSAVHCRYTDDLNEAFLLGFSVP